MNDPDRASAMVESILIITFLIGAILIIVRAAQIRFIRREFNKTFPDIPEELQVAWSNYRIWKFAPRNTVKDLGTGINTGQTLYHLSQIDPRVLEAMDQIKDPSQVMSYPKLMKQVAKTARDNESTWQGAVEGYKEAVGEDLIMEQLLAQGHHVELAESASQEGWDALVDGQPYRFEVSLDESAIHHHLEQFPEVPIYTVAEHFDTFADNPDVLCFEEISGVEIEELSSEVAESVFEIGDFDFKLPVITLALASFKNFAPVVAGHSEVATATKNTAADLIGSKFGLFAGSKAGGIIGSFAGPIGTLAGATIGGFAGAIGGKLAARGIKEKELRRANDELEKALKRYGKAYLRSLHAKANALEETARSLKGRFNLRQLIAPTPGHVVRSDARKAYREWARHCRELHTDLPESHRLHPLPGQTRGAADLRRIAELVLSGDIDEPVQSPEIAGCALRLTDAAMAVCTERRRLGYEN